MKSQRAVRLGVIAIVSIALLGLSAPLARPAQAIGPVYDGPMTQATGPAYFGPAPNAFPYCDNPTYFDPFPENVNPVGRLDPTGSPSASVTTDEITMDFTLTAEGAPDTQYPGFFPSGADGEATDQPKGVEMASDDAAVVTLSEPLFYSQWVFTDVDRANEGFFVSPFWTDPSMPGAVAVFGGDSEFTFDGTTINEARFNDSDTVGHPSEALAARVQVDFIGAVTGINMVRDTGLGQSGFAVGGGCSPIGVAKAVVDGPTWNGTSFDVTYSIKVRNNLPSAATLSANVNNALAFAASSTTAGTPMGIDLTALELTDFLPDPTFSQVEVVSLSNTSGNVIVNDAYDGDNDTHLIAPGEAIAAETEEEFVLHARYVPIIDGPLGPSCQGPVELLNSAVATGQAAGVEVSDLSDEGIDPDPGVDNGAGTPDDPTVVLFDCPVPSITMTKTVVPAGGMCELTTEGNDEFVVGEAGDPVTWCFQIFNTSDLHLTSVLFDDPLLGIDDLNLLNEYEGGAPTLPPDGAIVFSLDGTVPTGGAVNTGSVEALVAFPDGSPVLNRTPVTASNDAAVGEVAVTLDKTVAAGAGADCADAADTVTVGAGEPVTYCFTVTNSGTVNLAVTEVVDETLGLTVPVPPAGQVLAPGASIVVSADGVATDLVNVASVTGTAVDSSGTPIPGAPQPNDQDDATVATVAPELGIVKTVVAGPLGTCPATFADGVPGDGEPLAVTVGDTVTFCISVRNNGDIALDEIVVADPQAPETYSIGTLEPGTEAFVSYDVIIVSDTPVRNVATAEGTNPVTGPTPPIEDTTLIELGDPRAEIELSKTVIWATEDCAGAEEGVDEMVQGTVSTRITWCYVVTNVGNVPLASVMLDDGPVGYDGVDLLERYGDGAAVLDVGESLTFAADGSIPSAEIGSMAKVVAIPAEPDGRPLVDLVPVEDKNDAGARPVGLLIVNPPVDPPAATEPDEPDEVLGEVETPLAVTGSSSALLVSLAALAFTGGGMLVVGARRRSIGELG